MEAPTGPLASVKPEANESASTIETMLVHVIRHDQFKCAYGKYGIFTTFGVSFVMDMLTGKELYRRPYDNFRIMNDGTVIECDNHTYYDINTGERGKIRIADVDLPSDTCDVFLFYPEKYYYHNKTFYRHRKDGKWVSQYNNGFDTEVLFSDEEYSKYNITEDAIVYEPFIIHQNCNTVVSHIRIVNMPDLSIQCSMWHRMKGGILYKPQ